jgi:hypothetical protein
MDSFRFTNTVFFSFLLSSRIDDTYDIHICIIFSFFLFLFVQVFSERSLIHVIFPLILVVVLLSLIFPIMLAYMYCDRLETKRQKFDINQLNRISC